MLFKTTEEIQQYLVVTAEFEFAAIKPFLAHRAEQKIIIPHVGQALYDLLDTAVKFNNYTETERLNDLLEKVRYPLANYAFAIYLVHAQTQKSKGGVFIENTNERKAAFQYMVNDERNDLMDAAWDGIEQLLAFLEANKGDYPEWVESSAYTEFKDLFIQNATTFDEGYNINASRRTYVALRGFMREVEAFKIKPLISPELFDELKAQIAADNLTSENEALLPFIYKAVANLSIAKATIHLPVRITADGIQLLSTSDRDNIIVLKPAEKERLGEIQKDCSEAGEDYLKQLNDFLYDNSDDYPTFAGSDTYIDPDDAEEYDQSDNGIVHI